MHLNDYNANQATVHESCGMHIKLHASCRMCIWSYMHAHASCGMGIKLHASCRMLGLQVCSYWSINSVGHAILNNKMFGFVVLAVWFLRFFNLIVSLKFCSQCEENLSLQQYIQRENSHIIWQCCFCLLRSVVMSIQLLPKLFSSFQQFVSGDQGPHWVTAWASRELNMMELFFNNVTHYVESIARGDTTSNSLYSPIEEIQARLQYLSSVFSCELSHQDFSKLTMSSMLYTCIE